MLLYPSKPLSKKRGKNFPKLQKSSKGKMTRTNNRTVCTYCNYTAHLAKSSTFSVSNAKQKGHVVVWTKKLS